MVFWQQDVYSVAMANHARSRLPRLGGVVAALFIGVEKLLLKTSRRVGAAASHRGRRETAHAVEPLPWQDIVARTLGGEATAAPQPPFQPQAGERQQRVLQAKAQARSVSFEDIERSAFAGTSIKDYVTAGQLADYTVFLASPRAATISGQALSVCGDTQMLS